MIFDLSRYGAPMRTPTAVQPRIDAAQARSQARDQVLVEHGIDTAALVTLSPQARFRFETALAAEAALRVRQTQNRAAGGLIDIRV